MKTLLILALCALPAFATHNGTLVGSPGFASAKFSNGLTTISSTQYITVPTGTFNWTSTSDWTVEAWVKTTSTGRLVAIGAAGVGAVNAFWFGVDSGHFVASVTGSGAFAGGPALDSGITINDGVYHHCAISMSASGTTAKLFVDGVLGATFSGQVGTPPNDTTSGSIGTFLPNPTAFSWDGAIDEVAVWNLAKYSATFTPPASPYIGSEVGLYALYHLEADGTDSVLTPASLTASVSTIIINSIANTVGLTGVSTSWTPPSTPTFTLVGGTGASITSETVSTSSTATIMISAGSATGTLVITDPSTGAYTTIQVIAVIYPDDSNIVYTGRWGISGSGATSRARTINAGSYFDAAISGATAISLLFDETGLNASGFPDVEYQVDGGDPTRTTLSTGAGMVIPVTFPVASLAVHRIRVWAEGITEGSSPSFNQWTSLAGVVSFKGFGVTSGAVTLAIPTSKNSIEFLGDSLTATIRQLSDCGGGSASNATCMSGHNGWPNQVGQYLGLRAIPVGFGGSGLTVTGSGGVPIANTSFPLVYAGTSYAPADKPQVVVITHGTNDGAASGFAYQVALTAYLTTIRAARPAAYIFCAGLPSNTHASDMSTVVTAQANIAATGAGKLYYLDYTALSLTTTDGVHFDTAAENKLAAKFATDIQSRLNTNGVSLGVPGAGAGPIIAQ